MSLSGLLVFTVAYLVAVASPGPGIAAVVARVLSRGTRGIGAFIAGFVVGDLTWFAIASAGLAVLAQTFALLFVAIKFAGAAYLLFMAWKLWTAPAATLQVDAAPSVERPGRLFATSLGITLGNPKVIVFFLALLPTVVDLDTLSWAGFVEIAGVITVVLSTVLGVYVLVASRARRLFTSPRALRRLNRGTGVVMAGAAIAVATR